MIEVDIFTNDIRIIKKIQKSFIINRVYTENKKLNLNKKHFLDVFYVKNKIDIFKKSKLGPKLAISYGFGIIFNKKIIENYKYGIWNIHTGDLPKYRGRHPITAAFLNNEKKIGLTIHLINSEIDRGYLLSKAYVKRSLNDDEDTIKKKLLKLIPKILKASLKNFQEKKLKKISKGTYYKPFYKGIIIDDPKKFSHTYIFNAVKAQKTYGGVLIKGERFRDVDFYKKKYDIKKKSKLIICKNGKKLFLRK